ncbi:MAG: serine hydrolase [Pseudonocardiales bacterium]|nr:MAG: serine hydrolase [Pseudonocardiales bacterium]
MALDMGHWQERLDKLAAAHRVPGAVLGLLQDGAVTAMATGSLNVETEVAATPDAVFQIGSITKSYTATMVMQLVDEGRVDLDAPVVSLLPELKLADDDAAAQVTTRHLLCHTSGIEGDHFKDTGRGDDALERYVASCARVGFSHPVGATMSYCNTGYNIAGRLVEKLDGRSWDASLHARIVEPLGLSRTVTLPEEALRFRTAYGHVVEKDTAPKLAPRWMLPRSCGPAGLITASAADLLEFARLHLDGGRSGEEQVLSTSGVAAMQSPQVELPDRWTLGSHWGLGWILYDWGGRRVIGHDGATIGQAAFLRIVPDSSVAVCLLTNGGHAEDLYRELFPELMEALCGIDMPPPLTPPSSSPRVDAARHAGVYERLGVRLELAEHDGGLSGRIIPSGELAEIGDDDPAKELEIVAVSDDVFLARIDDTGVTWTPAVFYRLADGSPYLHLGGRATPKVRDTAPATDA